MEYENKYASKGIGGTALGLSIGSLGAQLLSGGLGNVLNTNNNCACGDQAPVNRYEASLQSQISELKNQVMARDANTYTDAKSLALYQYVDGKFAGIEAQLCQQAVVNAQVTANLSCMQNTLNGLQALTKTIIPIDNVCPAPMPQFNSWTAPTAGA